MLNATHDGNHNVLLTNLYHPYDADDDDDAGPCCYYSIICRVKFFDHKKGFGIIVPVDGILKMIMKDPSGGGHEDESGYYINDDIKVFRHQLLATDHHPAHSRTVTSTTSHLRKGVLVRALLRSSSVYGNDDYTIRCDDTTTTAGT
ncbi:hypothetical protein FOZ62_017674, partial [Perkinsus olseni]